MDSALVSQVVESAAKPTSSQSGTSERVNEYEHTFVWYGSMYSGDTCA